MRHTSDTARRIAFEGKILQVLVGSGVHGVTVDNQDDEDLMGICIEPPEYVIGLRDFEQYIFRTQPEGFRSGPGDIDLTVYSLRKWMRLALQGNPTILLPLFVPDEHVRIITPLGRELRELTPLIVSKQAGFRFLGYLQAQRERLTGERGNRHTNRPELIDKYGFDTKFAYHMVRLGLQGVELLMTGTITLPIPEPMNTWLRELRVGGHSKRDALAMAESLEENLKTLLNSDSLSTIRERPDVNAVNEWLIYAYQKEWNDYIK